jgi:hypothetical protein
MQARQLPAIRGWNWIVEGFRLFRNNPALLTFLVFGYWLTLIFLNLLPLIGPLVAPLCVPALSVSVMNGCRLLERRAQDTAGFGLLFSGFQKNRNVLFLLGAIYLTASVAVFAATALVDDGALLRIALTNEKPPEDLMANEQLLLSLQFALLLMLPLLMAFWFAPMLSAWNALSAGKALFFSLVACLRNWRPFLVYGLGVAFISVLLPGALLGVVEAFSPALQRMMVIALSLPLLFVFVPTLFASFYVSYRDVFVAAAEPGDG